MLAAAREHYREQQRITALAVREGRRRASSGPLSIAQAVLAYQLAAITLTVAATPTELAEQGIDASPQARIEPSALLTSGSAAVTMLARADNPDALDRLVATLVQDAGRTAATVDIARRPAVTGWVRSLNLPSCSRCAVLAGRVYRHSTGFQRHPFCDCLMTPTTLAAGQDLVLDGTEAAKAGQITGLSKADLKVITEFDADLGQVVNVRRKQAGLKVGSSVMDRGGRPTPAGILRATGDDRNAAISLLKRHGYLT